jgi:hypothetical protein
VEELRRSCSLKLRRMILMVELPEFWEVEVLAGTANSSSQRLKKEEQRRSKVCSEMETMNYPVRR